MLLLLSSPGFTSTWLFEEGFEQGDRGTFSSTSDVDTRLRFVTKTVDGAPPAEGKWCLEADLGSGSANGYLQSTAFATGAGQRRWARFGLYLTPDVNVNADAGNVRIFSLRQSGTQIANLLLRKFPDSSDIVLSLGGPVSDPWADPRFVVPRGEWVPIEVGWIVDSGAGDGVFEVYWNGNMASLQYLTSGVAEAARFGVIDQSGRWSGQVYFDQVLLSSSRIYVYDWAPTSPSEGVYEDEGAPESGIFTTSGFAFTGPGVISQALLLGEAGDVRLRLYDTADRQYSSHQLREDLKASPTTPVAYSHHRGIPFRKGCYVALTGDSPVAIVRSEGKAA